MENRTGDSLLDTLGGGMTEELFSRLSRIRGLKVIAPQSVRELEGVNLTVAQVADTLDVDHLLQGTAFPHQDAARILVRLLRVDGEAELWSNDYSLDRTNQMRAVEEISDEVSAALLGELPTLSVRGVSRSTESPGYVSYLAGSRLLNSRTRDGVARSIDAFNAAIAQTAPWRRRMRGCHRRTLWRSRIGTTSTLTVLQRPGWPYVPRKRRSPWILSWQPDLPPGVTFPAWRWRLPRRLWRISLGPWSSSPTLPNVRAWYANLLVREGYYDQALAEAQRAVQLDPLSPARRTGLAFEALRAQDYDLAIREARTATSLGPEVILPRSIQALALLLSGRAEECFDLDLGPYAGIRAICLHDVGRIDRSAAIIDSLRTAIQGGDQAHTDFTDVIPAGDLAAYLAWTGSPDRAMQLDPQSLLTFPQSESTTRVLESGLFDELFSSSQRRREVSDIRGVIWTRVQRELAEAEFLLGGRDP